MITVFYDGRCGLCRREIAHYRRIAPAGAFDWQDITVDAAPLEALGVCYADGLRRLHVQDAQGRLQVGVDAFLQIWRRLPRWRVLAAVVALPGIRAAAGIAYDAFADWRFNRLAHCRLTDKADH